MNGPLDQQPEPTLFDFKEAPVVQRPRDAVTDEPAPGDPESDDQPFERAERLRFIHAQQHFYPESNAEFNRIMMLAQAKGLTQKHLNEVFRNRKRHTGGDEEKAAQTLQSVIGTFQDYATTARRNAVSLDHLTLVLAERPVNALTGFANLPFQGETPEDTLARRGLTLLTEHVEVASFIDGANPVDPFLKPWATEKITHRDQRVVTNLGSLRAGSIMSLTQTVREEQAARFHYWIERLGEAKKHAVARPMAVAALAGFKLQ